jgi:hypothetical protein
MALDPLSTTAGKSAVNAAIKPTLAFLRQQVARRGAPFADFDTLRGADRELDEAIGVLQGKADSLSATVFNRLKGIISDRPDSFSNKEAREFIGDQRVVALIKSGARHSLRDEDIDDERTQARALHAEKFGEDGIYGETLIEDAIAFAALTLLAHLTPADRQMIELIVDVRQEMRGGFDQVLGKLGEMQLVQNPDSLDSAPYDDAVRAGVLRLRRQRMLHEPPVADRATAFGARVESALRLASPQAQGDAFKEVAVVLSRVGRVEEARSWLEKAEALGADTTTEHARIAIIEKDYDVALKMLRDRNDPVSFSLVLDAIAQRDGDDAFFVYLDENLKLGDLTGAALQNAAARKLLADRPDEAADILRQATDVQISESPVILFIRARLSMAKAVPPEIGKRLLEHEGMLPRSTDFHDDAVGRRHLDEARSDLERLKPILPDLESTSFTLLVDINLTALSLCSADPAVRAVARNEFIERMKDPAQDLLLAPLAKMYSIDVDWTALKARLSRAEKLGGYDEAQLRTAFTIVMDEGTPAEVADFVHRYRDDLEHYSTDESVVAIEIEALAKSGRKQDALDLLEAETEKLDAETVAFLKTTIAELDGADTIQSRLDQFEATGSAHDLEILVNIMGGRGDPRVGQYLVKLWRSRRQVEDARRGCEALLRVGDELAAEAFLDELGDEARADPLLRTHLAWSKYRQGRLGEAAGELDALAQIGVDDGNTRRLRIYLAVESGRWSDLEAHVQRDLANQANRDPQELIASARIAMNIGSAATMDLLVAATGAAPADPRIAFQAYITATEAGLDRELVVGQWLKLALENKDEVGLIEKTGMDEVIEMMTNSRKESERIGGLINDASVPIFMGIGMLGGSQSELVIHQMSRNESQTDPRRRSVVPLYAGNRLLRFEFRPKSISFDPLSILVLHQLGLLDQAIDAFDDVVLPSGTLHSFFEDRGKAAHSQPSRVNQAKRIKEAVACGLLKVSDSKGFAETRDVDAEFATLFADAEKHDGYLIDTGPLHPPGQTDSVTDPAPYRSRLMTPIGLVSAMQGAGAISRTVANAAEKIVACGGQRFPNEPALTRGKPLYLTSTAVHYMVDADILPALKSYAGELFTSQETIMLADREIASGAAAETIRAGIEPIRAVLARALSDGRVRIGPARRLKNEDELDEGDRAGSIRTSPVMSVLRDTAGIDAFVCDDRAMNKYQETTDQTGKKVIFLTTADLLGIMRAINVIDDEKVDAAREKLRRSGAALMPVDPDEFRRYVRDSDWSIGPNAELRAVRDSIHLPLARKIVQIPQERAWVRGVCLAISYAIRGAWADIEDDAQAEAAANWLLDLLPDIDALSEGDSSPDRTVWISEVTRMSTWAMAGIIDLSGARVERYRTWFANRVQATIERRDPGAFDAVGKFLFASLARPLDPDEGDD